VIDLGKDTFASTSFETSIMAAEAKNGGLYCNLLVLVMYCVVLLCVVLGCAYVMWCGVVWCCIVLRCVVLCGVVEFRF
jgi:hypothetical protein